MDRDDGWSARGNTTPQDRVWEAIKEYHYFAPAMLSLREPHRRRGWEEPTLVPVSVRVPLRAARRRLGAVLLRLGGYLCDAHPAVAQWRSGERRHG